MRNGLSALELEKRELGCALPDLTPRLVGQRDQALVREVAFFTRSVVARELAQELRQTRHLPDVSLLQVEVEGAGDRVLTVGDVVEGRLRAVDDRALDLVLILVEERES